jgi:hypothetical protein
MNSCFQESCRGGRWRTPVECERREEGVLAACLCTQGRRERHGNIGVKSFIGRLFYSYHVILCEVTEA